VELVDEPIVLEHPQIKQDITFVDSGATIAASSAKVQVTAQYRILSKHLPEKILFLAFVPELNAMVQQTIDSASLTIGSNDEVLTVMLGEIPVDQPKLWQPTGHGD
jgi:hypothetical protein